MKEFIVNLYANKYFPIYLGIIIIVLLIAFFIVFFLGKKDQKKIEETQKLNKEDLQNGNVKNVSSESNNSVVVQSNIVNDSKNNSVEVKNDNTAISNNTNIQKTPTVNNTSQITNNVPNKPVNEIDNTPKVSTPTQSNINNANVTSSNEVKPTNITPNVSSSVQSNTVNVTENKTPETKPNIIVNNNPKDIVMPTIEDNKPIINANSELKNETVKTNNITSSNVVQNLTDDDDSYKASSSKLDNSSQNALNRFQNIASSIDKELTELENKQKTFNQKNANIENNNLNISNEPIKEEPKLVEEKKESNTTVVNNVYSSVYVPNNNQNIKDKEPKNSEEDIDETMSIELPKLKEEPILKDENPDKFNFI